MSLLRLLATGKSLIEFKDTPGVYRLASQRLLPHFGPARNPFCTQAKPAPESAMPDRKASATGVGHGFSEALWLKAVSLVEACGAKIRGLLGHASGRAAKPAIPRFTKPPVQGELSLDEVRVVRNDLSDADPEVVPASRSAARGKSTSPLRSEEHVEVGGSCWGRAALRIFGASKT